MARYRLLITLAIVSLAFAAYGDQPVFSPRDPGAARDDFSNVDPTVAFEALGLGTIAGAPATDYVATGTFTDHTEATGISVHGLGSMATASADDYYTKSEMDATLGSISAALDAIIGAP